MNVNKKVKLDTATRLRNCIAEIHEAKWKLVQTLQPFIDLPISTLKSLVAGSTKSMYAIL